MWKNAVSFSPSSFIYTFTFPFSLLTKKCIKKYVTWGKMSAFEQWWLPKAPFTYTKRCTCSQGVEACFLACDRSALPSTFLIQDCLRLLFCCHFSREGSGHWSKIKVHNIALRPVQHSTSLMLVKSQGRRQGEGDNEQGRRREKGTDNFRCLTVWVACEINVSKYRYKGLT